MTLSIEEQRRALGAIASVTSLERNAQPELDLVQATLLIAYLTTPESRGGVSQSLHREGHENFFGTAKAHLARFKKQNPGVSIPMSVNPAEAKKLIASLS